MLFDGSLVSRNSSIQPGGRVNHLHQCLRDLASIIRTPTNDFGLE